MSTEQLQPPEPTASEVRAGMERQARMDKAFTRAMLEVMSGTGPFWADWRTDDHWDNEQHLPIAWAVGSALADETLTAEQFRRRILAVVAMEGQKYAASAAEDVE